MAGKNSTEVTHDVLAERIDNLATAFDAHRQATDARDVEIRDRFTRGEVTFERLNNTIDHLTKSLDGFVDAMTKQAERLAELEKARIAGEAQRSLLEKLIGSRLIPWLAAAFAGAYAWIEKGGAPPTH